MKKAIEVKCKKKSLAQIRDFVNTWLQERKITGVLANQIVLAVDEACANCIIHQHKCDGTSKIEIGMYQEPDNVLVEIKDSGKAFPIDQYKPKKLTEIIRKRKKGGMGIYLIHSIMDEIEIDQQADHFVYKLRKHVGQEALNGKKG
jgi:serine/threonine-protein kinase RsbW